MACYQHSMLHDVAAKKFSTSGNISDTPNGRIRRDQRRAVIAAKRVWLEM